MKRYLPFIALMIATACPGPSFAQVDLGRIFEGNARQSLQRLERHIPAIKNQVRRHIQEQLPPIRRYVPPVHTNPSQPCPIQSRPGHIVTYPPSNGSIASPPHNPPNAARPKANKSTKPKPKQPKLPNVEAGSLVTIEGNSYGKDPGQVFVKISTLILKAETVKWSNTGVEAQIPDLPLVEANQASIIVLSATEDIVDHMEINLVPAIEANTESTTNPTAADPAASLALPTVSAGQQLTIEGDLGSSKGRVELRIGKSKIAATIIDWQQTEVTFQIPELRMDNSNQSNQSNQTQPTSLVVLTSTGQIVDSIAVEFLPRTPPKTP